MSQTIYPDTEVAYWVILADDAFSVEVVTQWNHPRTVTPFATAADANANNSARPTARFEPPAPAPLAGNGLESQL